MNAANLQLEGLYLALGSFAALLVQKGLVSTEELDGCLARAEATAAGDERFIEDLTPANRDAICFPIRFLRAAVNSAGDGDIPGFAELARQVGQTKARYNDQM